MAGRRLQDWTNRNLFIGSFDSLSYRNAAPTAFRMAAANHQSRIEEDEEWGNRGWGEQQQGGRIELQGNDHLPINADDDKGAGNNLASYNAVGGAAGNKTGASGADDYGCYGGIGGGADEEKREDEDGDSGGGGGGARKTITALQAAWNVTNAIQGMFIVGLPFAVKVGGWSAILALVGVAWICYRTGLALIECLYEEQEGGERKRVRDSYREVAEAVRPGLGKYVLAAQLTELASTCILYIVLAGDLLQGCFPGVDRSAWMMLTSVVLLGTAFLDDLRIVSHLSLANAVSHLVVNFIMLLFCLGQFSAWRLSSVAIIPNFRLFPTVIGVVVFGYTSHIFLPALEGSMVDRRGFKPMLAFSHLAAAIFKALFGLVGFLTFAEFTQKEISNSLPNQAFKVLINLCLVSKALLSYPLPYFAIVQLLADNFFRGVHKSPFPGCYGTDFRLREWALSLRILLILWTLWMALSVPYLVELMGLVGNITGTVLSFIWPAYFHLRLHGAKLTQAQRRFDKFVIGGGIGTCVLGVYYSFMELNHAIRMGADEG